MRMRYVFGIGTLLLASVASATETKWTIERLLLGSPWDGFPVGTAIVFNVTQPGMRGAQSMTQVLVRDRSGALQIAAVTGKAKRTQSLAAYWTGVPPTGPS